MFIISISLLFIPDPYKYTCGESPSRFADKQIKNLQSEVTY